MPKNQKAKTPIEATVHDKAHRSNIPTTELGSFLADQDKEPKPVLYSRDSSLDPQLVWKGKDEQGYPLEVSTVPIYIQEKIHPKALIEALRAEKGGAEVQQDLWGDFDGIQFDELVEFYQHEQNWSNRLILGDSLLVMTSLAEKEGLKGKVQMIYMDPPYGIKFGSNWQVSTRKRDVHDGRVEDATRQPEQVKAFRDTWVLGIHSYLTYLRDRLSVASELLTESGSIFVQIGDENVHLVRSLLDEVFGSENFINLISVVKRSPQPDDFLSSVTDYLLWYGKNKEYTKFKALYKEKLSSSSDGKDTYTTSDLTSSHFYDSPPFEYQGRIYSPRNRYWSTSITGLKKLALSGRLVVSGNTLRYKRYHRDFPYMIIGNNWADVALSNFGDEKIYVVQTASKVLERCMVMATDPGDLVLDPTCGSGTTAYVAEQWGRRWITIDTSRVALTLARQRLMAAKYPYYFLADVTEHIKMQSSRTSENIGFGAEVSNNTSGDIRKGFVYKTAPHVTLKSIANNPDIREGIPRAEIDVTIARHADQETLYDQPYEDKKIVRVTGPFTVESLSPHVTLPLLGTLTNDNKSSTVHDDDVEHFQRVVLDHLRKAGVQNTVRSERLVFASIESWAGRFVHAVGTYNENGVEKRAAICIGPEYGTVDADLVRQSAKEAAGFFDLLIICGFAFDGYIAGELRKLGNLTILKATMNPDLAMGDELLKKTGSGNLFMVFGEPDIEMRPTSAGLWEIEVRGVDVYNPTTGEIRSHSTDDIACWFIDTSYNGESFFVRHAYFCGGNEPYESLKRVLRADIDEEAWNSLYRTTSRPFPTPETGRIAVKVINHYGDEVMKVLEIGTAHS